MVAAAEVGGNTQNTTPQHDVDLFFQACLLSQCSSYTLWSTEHGKPIVYVHLCVTPVYSI